MAKSRSVGRNISALWHQLMLNLCVFKDARSLTFEPRVQLSQNKAIDNFATKNCLQNFPILLNRCVSPMTLRLETLLQDPLSFL
jgi:hypothetical protein